MTTALHLARSTDLETLAGLMARYRAEAALTQTDDDRTAAVAPLLEGSPYGTVYLLGPARAPVGYVILTFGWSVAFGGMESWIEEIYVRPSVRRRGIATEVLFALGRTLQGAGVRALHLGADHETPEAHRLSAKAGFARRDPYSLMTRQL